MLLVPGSLRFHKVSRFAQPTRSKCLQGLPSRAAPVCADRCAVGSTLRRMSSGKGEEEVM